MNDSIGTAAVAVLANPKIQNIITKLFEKIYNKIMLKPMIGVVINDLHRSNLKLDFEKSKYQVIDLEKIYYILLEKKEDEKLENLKKHNPRVWLFTVKNQFKIIMTNLREMFKDEQIVCVMSNYELAKELKIDKIHIFVMDDDLEKKFLKDLSEDMHYYYYCMKHSIKNLFKKEYKSKEYLEFMINKILKDNNKKK